MTSKSRFLFNNCLKNSSTFIYTTREHRYPSRLKDSCPQNFRQLKMRNRSIIKLYSTKKQISKGRYEEVD